MISSCSGRHALGVCAALAILAGCGGSQGQIAPVATSGVHSATSYGNCPPLAGGTGILPDGDFSQGTNWGDQVPLYHNGQVFAPYWEVSKKNINFNGSTWGNVDSLCTVDLDGNVPGAIKSSAFSTKPGASYTVSFILSGNGYGPPTVKTMKVSVAHQFASYTWNISGGNNALNGDWQVNTWVFKANQRSAVLHFTSEDPKGSVWGPVIAGISVTEK
jgi:Protein of unknown function (DUF642)